MSLPLPTPYNPPSYVIPRAQTPVPAPGDGEDGKKRKRGRLPWEEGELPEWMSDYVPTDEEREEFLGEKPVLNALEMLMESQSLSPESVSSFDLGNTWFGRAAKKILETIFPWMSTSGTQDEEEAPVPAGAVPEAPEFLVGGVSPGEFTDTARRAGAGEEGAAAERANQLTAARQESAERLARIDQLISEFSAGTAPEGEEPVGAQSAPEGYQGDVYEGDTYDSETEEPEKEDENEGGGGGGRVSFF